jgi:ubiquinone/menaquinone biosynthesis C-methylase UbiE
VSHTDIVFAGSIPAVYNRYVAPLLLEPYAADLAVRVANIATGRVLEAAAGTGVVTRELDRTLPEGVEIIATDLNQPMIDFAAGQPGTARVAWRQADALTLPFKDNSFDAVVCQFGVMFFPDKVAAFREALRVLKPGGRFVFNVWDRIEENEIAQIVTEAMIALFQDEALRFFARTPHGYHDLNLIRRDLAAAGFSSVEAETVARLSRAGAALDPAIGLCQGTPLRNAIESRDPRGLEAATKAAERAVAARFGNGPIAAKMQAHIITAVR